jgi:uncharacterized protein (TIGR02246 family)
MGTDAETLGGLLAEAAIRRTLAEYCQSCDDGRFADFGRCFTEDAEFTVLGRRYRGRAAIEEWIAQAMPPERRGKHVTANSVVRRDGDRAVVTSDYLFLVPDEKGPRITVAGRYDDELVRDGEQWLIARRAIGFLRRPGHGEQATDAADS